MTANGLTHVVEWLRRRPKLNAQIRSIILLTVITPPLVFLIYSLKDLQNNEVRAFALSLLEMGLALLLSVQILLIAAVFKGVSRSGHIGKIVRKTLSGKARFVFVLSFLLLLALPGPIAISLSKGVPLSSKEVAEYIQEYTKECLVSLVLIVLLLVIRRLLIWAINRSAIDINTADKQKLESLPGIGPMLTQRIIERRPFEKIEDITKVPGIGDGIVSQMKYKVKVGRTVEPR